MHQAHTSTARTRHTRRRAVRIRPPSLRQPRKPNSNPTPATLPRWSATPTTMTTWVRSLKARQVTRRPGADPPHQHRKPPNQPSTRKSNNRGQRVAARPLTVPFTVLDARHPEYTTIVWAGAEHTIGLGVRPPVTATTTPTTDSNKLGSITEWIGAEHTTGLGVRPSGCRDSCTLNNIVLTIVWAWC